ncbi:shikimate dehydrogenase [Terrabacter sp. Soil810]|uniref:shikimate dehydrogenase n=1 Tax=Terrabacter sp. Soil810 TaxID=1736418 RepID=UPI00070AA03F|nr:shikimate dehydrogenase [Terrabacter sp. Soil810]KRF41551.1 shikimate dehydrogenase [Terrabacter sp. Soil810]
MLNEGRDVARHCAVWGSPIGHSLSPVLHRAAYAALGLHDWSYDRREVDEAGFAAALAGLDATWVGLSLTMPLKEVAFRSATTVTTLAAVTGAANTLVRDPDGSQGWTAHNTDVHGITMALRVAGCTDPSSVLVVGSGATARAAIAAVSAPRGRVVFMVRDRVRPETLAQARQAGLAVEVVHLGEWATAADVDAVVSTVPPASVPGLGSFPEASEGSRRPVVLDVVYGSGETALQRAARDRGWAVAAGTDMLLHQATEQVRLMTGRPAPLAEMSHALRLALRDRREDP